MIPQSPACFWLLSSEVIVLVLSSDSHHLLGKRFTIYLCVKSFGFPMVSYFLIGRSIIVCVQLAFHHRNRIKIAFYYYFLRFGIILLWIYWTGYLQAQLILPWHYSCVLKALVQIVVLSKILISLVSLFFWCFSFLPLVLFLMVAILLIYFWHGSCRFRNSLIVGIQTIPYLWFFERWRSARYLADILFIVFDFAFEQVTVP